MSIDAAENVRRILESSENIIITRDFVESFFDKFKGERTGFTDVHDDSDTELLDSLSCIVSETAKNSSNMCDSIKDSLQENVKLFLESTLEKNGRVMGGVMFFSLTSALIYHSRLKNYTIKKNKIKKTLAENHLNSEENVEIVDEKEASVEKNARWFSWFKK